MIGVLATTDETFLILLARHFQVVRLLFPTFGFSLWALLLVEFHGFSNGEFGLCIGPFRKNDQPKRIAERGTDQFEGVLPILPRRDGLLLCVICGVHP